MDAADYTTMDDDISVADNNTDGYKIRLLADLRRTDNSTSSNHGKEQNSRDDEVEKMLEETIQCGIKNVMQTMHYNEQLKLLFIEKDYGPVLDSLVKTQFKLLDFLWKSQTEAK